MPTAYFGLNVQVGTGSTVQVRRYNGLTASLVGTAFGSGETSSTNAQPLNRVIQFGSQNTFLAFSNNTISRSTDAGTTWTAVHTIPGLAGTALKTGLNVVTNNGVPTICCMWLGSAGTSIFGSYSTDGINWTNTPSSVSAGSFSNAMVRDTIFRNSLYAFNFSGVAAGGLVFGYTPGANAPFSITIPINELYGVTCVFNDTLVYCGSNNSTGNRNLYALDGGSFIFKVALTTAQGTAGNGLTGMLVDSNSGNLIVFNRKATPGAWGCWSVDSSYIASDISSTVLPDGMLASTASSSKVATFVDGEASPGSNPDKYLFFAASNVAGTPWTLYKWNGTASKMTNIDFGGTNVDALSISNNCQGVGFWTSGENTVELLSRTPVSGGIRLSFKLYSTGGAAVVSVRALYGTQFEEYPLTLATISDNTNGAISANVNTGLTADNGVTTFQFTWNSITDGVAPGDRFRLILEAFV